MRNLLTVILVAVSMSAGAQTNRWFGMNDADSTQWGWNLTRYMFDYYYLPDIPVPEGPLFEFTYAATDTVSIEDDGYYVTFGGFYIMRNEVTQQQWIAVMGSANPCWIQRGDDLPATIASPEEAVTFCHKLDSVLTFGFRIPTLGEWIFAAKGGHYSEGYNYAGSNNPNHVAWHKGNSGGQLHPVQQKVPNELGIYDMTGNVFEWCQDWYGDYSSAAQTNPTGPTSGSYRVVRGGNWRLDASKCRVSSRTKYVPSAANPNLGLRLAL